MVLIVVWHFPFWTGFIWGFLTEITTTFCWVVSMWVGWVGFGVEVVEGFLENAIVNAWIFIGYYCVEVCFGGGFWFKGLFGDKGMRCWLWGMIVISIMF